MRRPLRHLMLFLSSLLLCLWLGGGFSGNNGSGDNSAGNHSGNIAWANYPTSESITATQLMQQGWERYQSGDLQGAIADWQNALGRTAEEPSALRAAILKQLVQANQQTGEVDQAIAYLEQLIAYYRQTRNPLQVGRTLTEQAQAYSSLGQQRRAIALLCHETDALCTSDSALAIARYQTDIPGEVAALGSLGNAYRLRGDYDRALQNLKTALLLAKQIRSQPHIFAALNGLGNTYASLAKRADRHRQSAQQSTDELEAQAFAQTTNRYDRAAIDCFIASLTIARTQKDVVNELRSLLNLIVPLQRSQPSTEPQTAPYPSTPPLPHPFTPSTALEHAQTLLSRLPASREKAYAAMRLATLTQLVEGQVDLQVDLTTHCSSSQVPSQAVTLLQQAIAIAQQIGDRLSEAFALGRLGHVYECRQDYGQALTLTQQAQFAVANDDSRYLWEWQSGRILRAQEKPAAAIAAYTLALKTLRTIRGDLAIASRDFQFDFRDTVEPVYRELTALYLEQASRQKQPQRAMESKNMGETDPMPAAVKTIELALETIDSLRLAELQNYLGEDCVLNAMTKPVTVIDSKTAVLSSIILGDRVAVILTLPAPDHRFRSQIHWLPTNTQTVKAAVNDLRRRLEKRSDLSKTYQARSQQVYDWFIRPFAQNLQATHIETLVFIQDGILRSIPMAALYDGKQFLVEQYAIASTLSLTLVDPTPLDRASLKVLGFGLTKPSVVEGPTFFARLSHVKAEIDSLQVSIPGSKGLLDGAFTLDRLRQELTQNVYPIVHLATHGRFGIDASDTFLVTGEERGEGRGERGVEQASLRSNQERTDGLTQTAKRPLARLRENSNQTYNEKLTMNALYQMIRTLPQSRALELLTLTACETAAGSDRDALGIAGISLQAGARSTVASLWQVDDQATAQLITHFYRSLKQGMSRAKALQAAQKTWLQQHAGDRKHPGYWAALILVGNWL